MIDLSPKRSEATKREREKKKNNKKENINVGKVELNLQRISKTTKNKKRNEKLSLTPVVYIRYWRK